MIDIEIQETPTKGHCIEPYIYKLVHFVGYDKVKAIERKRELEQAQKVVSNIINRISVIENMFPENDTWTKAGILDELYDVLKKAMK